MPDTPPLAAPGTGAPAATTYDEVPYDTYPFAQSHPSRLATVATLFGLDPPPVESCRVLELGCANGGNLIPMADGLPGSRFVGVDYSARQIADAERWVRAAGLPNVTLRHASILDVDESYGPFDYVVCHGVYSWVPDAVREKILAICRAHLTPTGVAYVSYNTYPGWHMRGLIRDMMRYHAARFDTPAQRIRQSRALLDFLVQAAPANGGAYSTLLRDELQAIGSQSDRYLYHEHLEEVNDPVYFYQFAEAARRHGLRYLGEARLTTMVPANFGPEVQKVLSVVAPDQVQAEQYLDFVRNRTFRETLLVRADAAPNWSIRPASLRRLHVAATLRPPADPGDVRLPTTVQYPTKSGMTVSVSGPVVKAAMRVLRERWPGTVPFPELEAAVAGVLGGPPPDPNGLAVGLLNAYLSSDLLQFHATPLPAAPPGERPVAPAAARAALALGAEGVTNRRHDFFRPNDLERRLIPLLDGSRDRAALVDRLAELAAAGELTVQREGHPVTEPEALRRAFGVALGEVLDRLAEAGVIRPPG